MAARASDVHSDHALSWRNAEANGRHWLEYTFAHPVRIGEVHIHAGFRGQDTVRDFHLCFWSEDAWVDVPSARRRTALAVAYRSQAPWTYYDQPLIDNSPDPDAPDALAVSNHTVVARPENGGLIIYKAIALRGAFSPGEPVMHLATVSDPPLGPFGKQAQPLLSGDNQFFASGSLSLWHDGRNYPATVKDMTCRFTGVNLSLPFFNSDDGLTALLPTLQPPITGLRFTHADRSAWGLRKLERPQLLFRAISRRSTFAPSSMR